MIGKERQTMNANESETRPTCYADNGDAPYCAGRDCPDWPDCHGDKLRGHSDTTGVTP